MVFSFVQKFFSRTTQELEYLFFLSRKAQIFFPEYNIQRETEYTDWIIRIIASKVCYFRKEIILETMARSCLINCSTSDIV
jgi:hypothetical protein